MRQAAENFEQNFSDLTGFFSWKFGQKMDIDFERVQGFVHSAPGMDCYIFSHGVSQVAYFLNVWQQGEFWHSGMTAKAEALLSKIGYPLDLSKSVDYHLTTAYSNYWIGSPRFWRAYLDFMGRVFDEIEAQKPGTEGIDGQSAFWRGLGGRSKGGDRHAQALPIIPYIVERLFSVFVRLHPEYRMVAWEYPPDELKAKTFDKAGLIPLANWCKMLYSQTGDEKFVHMFREVQNDLNKATNGFFTKSTVRFNSPPNQ
jgi:hypothetical protein